MRKEPSRFNSGFSLVEVIISAALVLLLSTLFVQAVVGGQQGTQINGEHARASLVAEEGLEALYNLRDNAFSNLVDGSWGLTQSGGTWALTAATDTEDIFTRRISIADIDASTKVATATVTWQEPGGRTGSVSLTSYISDFGQLIPEAKDFSVDISGGHISNNTRLVGVKIKNTGNNPITVSTTTVYWSGGSATSITEIDINGKTVWSPDSNVGYPDAYQASGGSEGMTSVTIGPNSGNPLNNIIFDQSIHGASFTIVFTMSDNSVATTTIPTLL